MKLKICGIKSIEDVYNINEAGGVDYGGFVFAPHPLAVSKDTASRLRSVLDPAIKSVGVFVDESQEFVEELVSTKIIDMVQFHGDKEYGISCPAIRAYRMRTTDDIVPTECEFVLFDAYKAGERGSTGGMFDWRLLAAYNNDKPYFLAGGINISNIADAVMLNPKPYCIDISSGVKDASGAICKNKIIQIRRYLS